jgi:DnaK suppressor protein
VAKKKTRKLGKKATAKSKTARVKVKTTPKKTTKKVVPAKPPAKKKATKTTPKGTRTAGIDNAVSRKSTIRKPGPLRIAQSGNSKPVPGNTFNLDRAAEALDSQDTTTPLTAKELEFFRELLYKKRSEIAGDVSTLRNQALSENRQEASGDLSNMPIHMADLGTDNYEKEFTLGLLESERNLLWEIDEALKRIDAGTFGICVATGKQIGKNRLKAQPWVKYSYEYMLAQERGQSQNRW